jgi:opacity protein-like surface antigen
VELAYSDLGKYGAQYDYRRGSESRTTLASWDVTAASIELTARVPVVSTLSAFGRVGVAHARLGYSEDRRIAGSLEERFDAPSDSRTVISVGAGADWYLNPNVFVRVDWRRLGKVGRTFSFAGPDAAKSNGRLSYDELGLSIGYRY